MSRCCTHILKSLPPAGQLYEGGAVDMAAGQLLEGGAVDVAAGQLHEGGAVDMAAGQLHEGGAVDMAAGQLHEGAPSTWTRTCRAVDMEAQVRGIG